VAAGSAGGLVGQTLGEYRLTSLLGAGGMAEVYRGEDTRMGREVAVKVLPAMLADDPEYVRRFRDEAERVGSLDHPNIVRMYSSGEERGLLYLVMPLLRESLRDRMEREGLLPLADASRLVVQVAAALDAAHARGIVHRDVKPENSLLNAQGRALLTDFGIARDEAFLRETVGNRTLAATGLPVGTPEYMAPEQLGNGVVDTRADIYALGVVLYELLTGAVPFQAGTPLDVAALVRAARFDPPSARNPLIWPELDAVVLRAMASDPDARYQDTRSFALALRDAVMNHRGGAVTAGARGGARSARMDAPTVPLAVAEEPERYNAPGAPGAL
jgi:serine/threonine-protein kinase